MTLDEYMARGIEHYELQHEDACNMLDEAIGRLADMTADRDSWMEQCMDARKEWESEAISNARAWRAVAKESMDRCQRLKQALGSACD